MARKPKSPAPAKPAPAPKPGKPSALLDTRVIYCGDNLEQLAKLPDQCIDLIYIDPPFNSNRNYEVFWGESNEKRSFDDRHARHPVASKALHVPKPLKSIETIDHVKPNTTGIAGLRQSARL